MTKNDYEAEAARLALRTRDGRFALVRAMHQKVNEQDVEECLNELLNQFPNDKFIGSDFVSHTFECQKCSDWIEVGANTYRGPAFIARIDVVAQERNRASDAQRGVSLGYYTPGDVN
ncbi:hypothetical protein thalar_01791 [Litoreibacter arenae DSM 19593]|uniref:Uncharacterized protein n=2 Tax=Litoreibacter TaxID=947567 RepID=S9RLH2_9RHOB|nr:hypothetical protein thalar_01791 [Litoreibacter arenae DSM 19593]